VVAQYDYDTSIAGELPLKTGERVLVLSKQTGDAQWWSGRAANGRVGQFPCAYVEEVPAAAPAPAPVAAPATKSAVAAGGVGAAAAAAGLARAGTTARAAPPAKAPAKPGTRALVPPPIANMHTHSHSLTHLRRRGVSDDGGGGGVCGWGGGGMGPRGVQQRCPRRQCSMRTQPGRPRS
jgi:hypothetical protein